MSTVDVSQPVSVPVSLAEDEFWSRFQPIKNESEPNSSWDGCMFETYGRDLEIVQRVLAENPRRIWTILDCDGTIVVSSGFHIVNRLGYLITSVPVEESVDYEMVDSDSELSDEQ